jgi:hypothetical protein
MPTHTVAEAIRTMGFARPVAPREERRLAMKSSVFFL